MIATGGLLRFNARRQDSLRVKTHKPQPHKRKSKRKSRNEVVVVKGKLKLISASGLVAALGILVLLVGLVVAALGYWPRDGLFFTGQPQDGASVASLSISSSEPSPADAQKDNRGGGDDEERGGHHGFNQTQNMNRTWAPRGFLEVFLDRCLYSDRLKVLGPLIMGIGIFLFICANAVLHENRDKNTKVINLRDIYSTVIDLNRLRRPSATWRSSANGLVNYSQSQSLETRTRTSCTSPPGGEKAGGGEGSSSNRGTADGGGETVFSVCAPPSPSSSLKVSLTPDLPPTSWSPLQKEESTSWSPLQKEESTSWSPLQKEESTSWSPLQKEVLSSFTLPLRRPRPPAPHRRHSAVLGWVLGGREEQSSESEGHRREEEEVEEEVGRPPTGSSTPPPSCSSSSLHRKATATSLLLSSSSSLAPSHLSFSSVSHLLSSSPTPPPPGRRRSLPTTSGVAGYRKLTHGVLSSHPVTSHRKYSNRD